MISKLKYPEESSSTDYQITYCYVKVQSLGVHDDNNEANGYGTSTKSVLSRSLRISVSMPQLQKTYYFLLAEAFLNIEYNRPKYFCKYNTAATMQLSCKQL